MAWKEWSIVIEHTNNGVLLRKILSEEGVKDIRERVHFDTMESLADHLKDKLIKENRLKKRCSESR